MTGQRSYALGGKDSAGAATATAADRPLNWLTGSLLGLVRIVIGVLWFGETRWKMPPDFGCGADGTTGLCDWVGREVANPKFAWYKSFLVGFFQPNLHLFGWFVYFGELVIAILLILGLLTRLGGVLGAIQGVNLLIGLWVVPGEWYWTYVMLALINLVFTLTAAGRYLGLDALLHPRAVAAARRGGALARVVAALT
ncbi:MAG TPA: TQO small subunit DoxD [Thermomicrobiales bacterium]|nr:TQO small subunit DoxD [Thermomicrobiales bacterium]